MTKEQVFEILCLFKNTFHNFDFDQQKIDTWYRLLKEKDPEEIKANAERIALTSKYPPNLSDLLNKPVEEDLPSGPAVPDVEETKAYLQKYKGNNPASPEVIEQALENIRKTLGIKEKR